MSVVVVLVVHPIRMSQLKKNPNENRLVQVHHHHHHPVVHLDRMFDIYSIQKSNKNSFSRQRTSPVEQKQIKTVPLSCV
jgi:hypothetical protein